MVTLVHVLVGNPGTCIGSQQFNTDPDSISHLGMCWRGEEYWGLGGIRAPVLQLIALNDCVNIQAAKGRLQGVEDFWFSWAFDGIVWHMHSVVCILCDCSCIWRVHYGTCVHIHTFAHAHTQPRP